MFWKAVEGQKIVGCLINVTFGASTTQRLFTANDFKYISLKVITIYIGAPKNLLVDLEVWRCQYTK